MDITVTEDQTKMDAAVDHYLSNSELGANGVRVIRKQTFFDAMKASHGVTEDQCKTVQSAVDFHTTAAARVALADNENKLASATKDDLANDDYRRNMSSTVRLPTIGGALEVEHFVEKVSNVPARGDTPASTKVTNGRLRVSVVTKSRIDKSFHEESALRTRKALGLADA